MIESSGTQVDEDRFEKIRNVLNSLTDAVGKQMDDHNHEMVDGSGKASDIKILGDKEAVNTLYSQIELAIVVTADHMHALERLLTEPVMTFAPWTTARNVLEAASLAMWLLDEVDIRTRISRSLNLRLKDLREVERFARIVSERDSNIQYFESVQALVQRRIHLMMEDAKKNGIPEKRDRSGEFIGYADGLPSTTEMVNRTLGEGEIYRMLSAGVHGRTWAHLALSLRKGNATLTVEQQLTIESALFLIVNTIGWFARPVWKYFKNNGWDTKRLARILEVQYNSASMRSSQRFWRGALYY